MAKQEDSFVSRWSRRKRDARSEEESAAVPGAATESVEETESPEGDPAEGDPAQGDPEVVAKLPDIDSLDESSDFTPFMAKVVPEVLRRRALRKLWRLNPMFAHLDGLNDYDEDFTDAAALLAEVKTIYKVGKGMVSKEPAADENRPEVAEEDDQEQVAAWPEDAPAIAHDTSAEPQAAIQGEPDAMPESPEECVLAPAEEGATTAGGPGGRSGRSAAARRWGESSG